MLKTVWCQEEEEEEEEEEEGDIDLQISRTLTFTLSYFSHPLMSVAHQMPCPVRVSAGDCGCVCTRTMFHSAVWRCWYRGTANNLVLDQKPRGRLLLFFRGPQRAGMESNCSVVD